MRHRKLTIGLDADDVLFYCVSEALEIVNKKLGTNVSVNNITTWDLSDVDEDVKKCFHETLNEEMLYINQKVIPGAVDMVDALLERGHEVVFVSAMKPQFMNIRAIRLKQNFSKVPESNIMLGARKDLVQVDVLLDDANHNLTKTKATYPIVFDWPWNQSLTGFLRVHNYDEFLEFIDQISSFVEPARKAIPGEPYAIALIGPSGSGKTALMNELCKNPAFGMTTSYTTRTQRPNEGDSYFFVSNEEFKDLEAKGKFVDTTSYAENKYGLAKDEIERLWEKGKHAVVLMDISGAMNLKRVYGSRVATMFIRRGRQEVLSEIISRETSGDDKVNRIISLEKEYDNESMCDFIITNKGTIKETTAQILNCLM